MFVVNTVDEMLFFDTYKEAREAADEAILWYRNEAMSEGEWRDEVSLVSIYRKVEQAEAEELEPEGSGVDFHMRRFACDADTQQLAHEACVSRGAWKKTDEEHPPHGHLVLIVGEDSHTMWMGTYLEKWGELHGDGDESVDLAWLDHDEDENEYYFPAGWYGLGPYDGHANGWYQRVDLKAAWWRELPLPPPF